MWGWDVGDWSLHPAPASLWDPGQITAPPVGLGFLTCQMGVITPEPGIWFGSRALPKVIDNLVK